MSKYTVTKVLELTEDTPKDTIIENIKDAIQKEFKKVKIKTNKKGEVLLQCQIKTKFLAPSVVSIRGPIHVQTKGNKAKIMIDADTKTSGDFWFLIMLGFMFVFPVFLLPFLYFTQKKSAIVSLEKVLERMDFTCGDF